LWQTGLGRRYGVTLLEYRPSADNRELVTAAEALAKHAPEQSGGASQADARMSMYSSRLTQLTLRSIGIFRELKVEFHAGLDAAARQQRWRQVDDSARHSPRTRRQ